MITAPAQTQTQVQPQAQAVAPLAPQTTGVANVATRDEQTATRDQPEQELNEREQQKLRELQARDREVRAHEQAHLSAAGGHAKGGASYTYERGPDQRMYAVGGEVSVDTSKVTNDPVATLRKAQTIRRAALAPANPSSQDRRVAAKAAQMETEARMDISAQRSESTDETSTGDAQESATAEAEGLGESSGQTCPSCGGAHTAGTHAGMTAYAASTAPENGTQVEERY